MSIFKAIFLTLIFSFAHLLCAQERADFYDDFVSAKNAYTDVGEVKISNTPWFGPIQLENNSQEPLEITGQHSLALGLEIVSLPNEPIPAGSVGTIEVIYQPRSIGLLTPRIELTTNQGRKTALLRIQVTAGNDWEVLAFAWQNPRYNRTDAEPFLVNAEPLIEAIQDDPNDAQRMLIDPRQPERHQSAYIPGALSIQLHELMDRLHWRERDIYIIDEGSLQSPTLTALMRLQEAGFENLHWVRGGMRAWQAAGGQIAGTIADTGQWAGLYPSELSNSLLRDDFTILNASDALTKEKLEAILPKHQHAQWSDGLDGIDKEQPLLVVATQDNHYLNTEPLLLEQGFKNVYYLHGGVDRLIASLEAWNTPQSMRFHLVHAGARNPMGKTLPIQLVDRDCIDCLQRSRK